MQSTATPSTPTPLPQKVGNVAYTIKTDAAVSRLYFLDNMRVVLTVMVIAHHAAQPYGPTGGWWLIHDTVLSPILEPFFTVNRSFGMSLFFLISGYFMVMACDAKGPRAFLNSRFRRLGLPLLVFGLCMVLLQLLIFDPPPGQSRSGWPVEIGPMWYVEHLLIFSTAYALWRMIRSTHTETEQREIAVPGSVPILIFALALAAGSYIVRLWYPIDHWEYLLGFIRVAFADVPRDLSFFIIGALAYRYQWLSRFPARTGQIWLLVGLIAAGLCYAYNLWLKDVAPISAMAMTVIYPIWESVLCCGMCIGLTVLFRDQFNVQGRLGKAIAQSQYAAFIFHLPFVFLFQYVMVGAALPPLVKFVVVTLASVPITFLVSYWVRKPLHL